MERFSLPVEVSQLPSGEFVAACPVLEGCHVEGRTREEALERMEDMIKAAMENKSPWAVLAHTHALPGKVRRSDLQ